MTSGMMSCRLAGQHLSPPMAGYGAGEGTRTPTPRRQNLNLVRLPIPPHPQSGAICHIGVAGSTVGRILRRFCGRFRVVPDGVRSGIDQILAGAAGEPAVTPLRGDAHTRPAGDQTIRPLYTKGGDLTMAGGVRKQQEAKPLTKHKRIIMIFRHCTGNWSGSSSQALLPNGWQPDSPDGQPIE